MSGASLSDSPLRWLTSWHSGQSLETCLAPDCLPVDKHCSHTARWYSRAIHHCTPCLLRICHMRRCLQGEREVPVLKPALKVRSQRGEVANSNKTNRTLMKRPGQARPGQVTFSLQTCTCTVQACMPPYQPTSAIDARFVAILNCIGTRALRHGGKTELHACGSFPMHAALRGQGAPHCLRGMHKARHLASWESVPWL